jgi:hypothetical protein
MAYVAARRNGRFEIREAIHTPRGPRARSLAGFTVLTDEVLAKAARRAQRPFDAAAVIASGRRAGARAMAAPPADGASPTADGAPSRFLAASGRMARSLRRGPQSERMSPGEALIDLLGFADAVTANQPVRAPRPLAFPALARLVADHRAAGLASG